jgi:hypothetical protein
MSNQLCRFCTNHLQATTSYASVLVDTWGSVLECESQFVPSFTTWCMQCERLTFMNPNAFDDCLPVTAMVVHGPLTKQDATVRASSFEAQVVLWRQLRTLSLSYNVPESC